MKKLALRLDDLLVESFDLLPDAGAAARTVDGYQAKETETECIDISNKPTCKSNPCFHTCRSCFSCEPFTCDPPC